MSRRSNERARYDESIRAVAVLKAMKADARSEDKRAALELAISLLNARALDAEASED